MKPITRTLSRQIQADMSAAIDKGQFHLLIVRYYSFMQRLVLVLPVLS